MASKALSRGVGDLVSKVDKNGKVKAAYPTTVVGTQHSFYHIMYKMFEPASCFEFSAVYMFLD
jgi:hypothetical protein